MFVLMMTTTTQYALQVDDQDDHVDSEHYDGDGDASHDHDIVFDDEVDNDHDIVCHDHIAYVHVEYSTAHSDEDDDHELVRDSVVSFMLAITLHCSGRLTHSCYSTVQYCCWQACSAQS
jgi:hypothetical protein